MYHDTKSDDIEQAMKKRSLLPSDIRVTYERIIYQTDWCIKEEDVHIINQKTQLWCAKVFTTRLRAKKRVEENFYILVSQGTTITIKNEDMPVLAGYLSGLLARDEPVTVDKGDYDMYTRL